MAVLMMPAAVMAQGNPGPFGGVFGRAPVRQGQDQTVVEARSIVGGQYDSSILPQEGSPDTETQPGFGAGATARLSLQHQTAKLTAVADGAVSRTEYFSPSNYGVNLYGGSASVASVLTTHISAEAAGSYVHSPFYEIYPYFGVNNAVAAGNGVATPFTPYATQLLENDTARASAGVTARLSKRTKLSASMYRQQTNFAESDADFALNGYRAVFTWQLRSDLGVHAAYGLEHSHQSGELGQDFENETIDVGVDYMKSFSLARRTTLGFSTSSSLVRSGTSPRELRLNGGVVLTKYFRRTWRAGAHVTRATSFVPGFYEPVYSDSVGLSLGGMFSKRIDFSANADAAKGESAISGTHGFNTASASSRLSIAFSKALALFVQYAAYGYELPVNSNALGLSQRMVRQSATVGLSAYFPLYKKMGQ